LIHCPYQTITLFIPDNYIVHTRQLHCSYQTLSSQHTDLHYTNYKNLIHLHHSTMGGINVNVFTWLKICVAGILYFLSSVCFVCLFFCFSFVCITTLYHCHICFFLFCIVISRPGSLILLMSPFCKKFLSKF